MYVMRSLFSIEGATSAVVSNQLLKMVGAYGVGC